jgi:molybdopterin-containing oxidoreductase family membrane subunit
VEVSVNLAALAGFILMYVIFVKLFPIVALSDVRELEERQAEVRLGRARLSSIAGKD